MSDTDTKRKLLAELVELAQTIAPLDALLATSPPPELGQFAINELQRDWNIDRPEWLPHQADIEKCRHTLVSLMFQWQALGAATAKGPQSLAAYIRATQFINARPAQMFEQLLDGDEADLAELLSALENLAPPDEGAAVALDHGKKLIGVFREFVHTDRTFHLCVDVLKGDLTYDDAVAAVRTSASSQSWLMEPDDLDYLMQNVSDASTESGVPLLVYLLRADAAQALCTDEVLEVRLRLLLMVAFRTRRLPEFVERAATVLESGIQRLGPVLDGAPAISRLEGGVGSIWYALKKYERGLPYMTRSLAEARRIDDTVAILNRTRQIAEVLIRLNRWREALRYARWSTRLARRAAVDKQIARLLTYSEALNGSGVIRASRHTCNKALLLAIASVDVDLIVQSAHLCFDYAMESGDYDEAIRQLASSLSALDRPADTECKAKVLDLLGVLANFAGDTKSASGYLQHASKLYLAAQNVDSYVHVLTNVAAVIMRNGRPDQAISLLEGLMADERASRVALRDGGLTCAIAYVEVQRLTDALSLLAKLRATAASVDDRAVLLEAGILLSLGRPDLAMPICQDLLNRTRSVRSQAVAHAMLADAFDDQADRQLASFHLDKAKRLAADLGASARAELLLDLASVAEEDAAKVLVLQVLDDVDDVPEPIQAAVLTQWAEMCGSDDPARAALALRRSLSLASPWNRPDMLLNIARFERQSQFAAWKTTLQEAIYEFNALPLTIESTVGLRRPGRLRSQFTWKAIEMLTDSAGLEEAMQQALRSKSHRSPGPVTVPIDVVDGEKDEIAEAQRLFLLRHARENEALVRIAGDDVLQDEEDELYRRRIEAIVVESADTTGPTPKRSQLDPFSLLREASEQLSSSLLVETYCTPNQTLIAVARRGCVDVSAVEFGFTDLLPLLLDDTKRIGKSFRLLHAGSGLLPSISLFAQDRTTAALQESERNYNIVSGALSKAFGNTFARYTDDNAVTQIVLMPHGVMRTLPLHALVVVNGVSLLDRWQTAFMPDVAALHYALSAAPVNDACSLVLGKVDHSIPLAAVEVDFVSKLTGAARIENGDLDEINRHLALAGWVHVVGHGERSQQSPLDTGVMIGTKSLSIEDFRYRLKLRRGSIFTFAACDVGGGHLTPYDFDPSLPAALLAAGASTAVAPCWPVDDLCALIFTMLLMSDSSNASLAGRVTAAQRVLRSMKVHEFLEEWMPRLQRMADRRSNYHLSARAESMSGSFAFDSPIYWSPFMCFGGLTW